MNNATLEDFSSRPSAVGDEPRNSAEERTTLQYWLANEDVYTSTYVRKWLERTPPAEAADTLAAIAEYARPESRSLFRMFFLGLISTLTTAEIISEKSPAGRKAGIRAAMLLASRNDLRALAPLVRVFEPHWFWRGKYQEAVEAALLHLLSHAPEETDWTAFSTDLCALANAVQQIGHGRQELVTREADLLIATLQRLATVHEERTTALLNAIASAEVRTPQRLRVREVASAARSRSTSVAS